MGPGDASLAYCWDLDLDLAHDHTFHLAHCWHLHLAHQYSPFLAQGGLVLVANVHRGAQGGQVERMDDSSLASAHLAHPHLAAYLAHTPGPLGQVPDRDHAGHVGSTLQEEPRSHARRDHVGQVPDNSRTHVG